MKRLLSCLAVVACGHSSSKPAAAPPQQPQPETKIAIPTPTPNDAGVLPAATPEARAQELVEALQKTSFDAVEKMFTPKVQEGLPKADLEKLWKQLLAQAGSITGCDAPKRKSSKAGQLTVVAVPCHFAKGTLDFVLAIDDTLMVSGLHITPHESEVPWAPPPYAATDAHSRDLEVGDLPGTLTAPSSGGPFPCVVLVHGSGPNDRDETIGPNKPFADLALGLAAHGIATLRYDKRTRVKPESLPKDFTVEDETIKDAVIAADLCSSQPEIDHKRVYVLGHSLGAWLAPRIARQAKDLAGLVILAAPSRDLPDVVIDQLTYLGSDADAIAKAKADAKRIHELEAGAAPTPGEMYIGAPASYWKDLAKYDAPAVAATLKLPIFVGQGGRDYQVSPKLDFPAWQKALGKKPHDKVVLWPRLNHLLIAGDATSTPAEYEKPAHVDEQAIKDIADFIAPPKK